MSLFGRDGKLHEWQHKIFDRLHMVYNKTAWPFRLSWWSPSGWRLFSVTVGYYTETETPQSRPANDWTWLRIDGPGRGTHLWDNGLFYIGFFLPFGIAMVIRIPKEFEGERWGYAFRFSVGWKVYGNFSGSCKVQPDYRGEYHWEEEHWRVRGLRGGHNL
jgi:hypothetical protein